MVSRNVEVFSSMSPGVPKNDPMSSIRSASDWTADESPSTDKLNSSALTTKSSIVWKLRLVMGSGS